MGRPGFLDDGGMDFLEDLPNLSMLDSGGGTAWEEALQGNLPQLPTTGAPSCPLTKPHGTILESVDMLDVALTSAPAMSFLDTDPDYQEQLQQLMCSNAEEQLQQQQRQESAQQQQGGPQGTAAQAEQQQRGQQQQALVEAVLLPAPASDPMSVSGSIGRNVCWQPMGGSQQQQALAAAGMGPTGGSAGQAPSRKEGGGEQLEAAPTPAGALPPTRATAALASQQWSEAQRWVMQGMVPQQQQQQQMRTGVRSMPSLPAIKAEPGMFGQGGPGPAGPTSSTAAAAAGYARGSAPLQPGWYALGVEANQEQQPLAPEPLLPPGMVLAACGGSGGPSGPVRVMGRASAAASAGLQPGSGLGPALPQDFPPGHPGRRGKHALLDDGDACDAAKLHTWGPGGLQPLAGPPGQWEDKVLGGIPNNVNHFCSLPWAGARPGHGGGGASPLAAACSQGPQDAADWNLLHQHIAQQQALLQQGASLSDVMSGRLSAGLISPAAAALSGAGAAGAGPLAAGHGGSNGEGGLLPPGCGALELEPQGEAGPAGARGSCLERFMDLERHKMAGGLPAQPPVHVKLEDGAPSAVGFRESVHSSNNGLDVAAGGAQQQLLQQQARAPSRQGHEPEAAAAHGAGSSSSRDSLPCAGTGMIPTPGGPGTAHTSPRAPGAHAAPRVAALGADAHAPTLDAVLRPWSPFLTGATLGGPPASNLSPPLPFMWDVAEAEAMDTASSPLPPAFHSMPLPLPPNALLQRAAIDYELVTAPYARELHILSEVGVAPALGRRAGGHIPMGSPVREEEEAGAEGSGSGAAAAASGRPRRSQQQVSLDSAATHVTARPSWDGTTGCGADSLLLVSRGPPRGPRGGVKVEAGHSAPLFLVTAAPEGDGRMGPVGPHHGAAAARQRRHGSGAKRNKSVGAATRINYMLTINAIANSHDLQLEPGASDEETTSDHDPDEEAEDDGSGRLLLPLPLPTIKAEDGAPHVVGAVSPRVSSPSPDPQPGANPGGHGGLVVVRQAARVLPVHVRGGPRRGPRGGTADAGGVGEEGGPHSGQEGEQSRATKETVVTLPMLQEHFAAPIKVAAAALGLSLSCFKKVCRKLGVPRWPARKLKCLSKMRDTVVRQHDLTEDVKQGFLRLVERNWAMIMADPDTPMDRRFTVLRQVQYKLRSTGMLPVAKEEEPRGAGGTGGRRAPRRAPRRGRARRVVDSGGSSEEELEDELGSDASEGKQDD